MPLVILLSGVILLFTLIIAFKLNGFLALMLAAIFVGLMQGMEPLSIVKSIEHGLGSTFGHIGIIVVLGAIFGTLISEGGGAQSIASNLLRVFGKKYVTWAICLASFILGVILFWEVSFVLIIPIVYTIAIEARVKLLKVGLPFLMAITLTHCFLPPHPGPVAVASALNQANIGIILIYGLIISIPGALIFGLSMPKLYSKWDIEIPENLIAKKNFNDDLPSLSLSLLTAFVPVALILISVLCEFMITKDSSIKTILTFIGNPDIALLISVFIALYVFGLRGGRRKMQDLMKSVESSIISMGALLFVFGGGGAFKQVILDSGMADYIADITRTWDISPLLLAWLITCSIRLCVGSATVTVLTASAIILPILNATGANAELMVLAICTASVFGGPPNDVAFWFIKEYFNLSIVQTVKVWCVQATLLALYGLIGVLALNTVIGVT
ncbi:gluconate permease [Serratia sp. S1B]|nr:gluconate permease [Serratia sp. S1B]